MARLMLMLLDLVVRKLVKAIPRSKVNQGFHLAR